MNKFCLQACSYSENLEKTDEKPSRLPSKNERSMTAGRQTHQETSSGEFYPPPRPRRKGGRGAGRTASLVAANRKSGAVSLLNSLISEQDITARQWENTMHQGGGDWGLSSSLVFPGSRWEDGGGGITLG